MFSALFEGLDAGDDDDSGEDLSCMSNKMAAVGVPVLFSLIFPYKGKNCHLDTNLDL